MRRRNRAVSRIGILLLCCGSLSAWDGPEDQDAQADQSRTRPIQQGERKPLLSLKEPEDPRDKILYSDETERVKPLVSKLIRNTILDQKTIWTSPFHINSNNAKWWIGIGGATATLIAVDRHLSTQLPNSVDQLSFSRGISQAGAVYTLYPIAGAFYLGGALFDNAKARETGALGAEALTDALITVSVLKLAFGRERPLEGDGRGKFFKGKTGFPSGHSMMSFAFASVVSHEYRKYKIAPFLAYGVSTLISASRFSARKHFASDIIAGAGAGYFIGTYVFQTHEDHMIHKRHGNESAWLHPTLSPQIMPSTGTYGVALNWNR